MEKFFSGAKLQIIFHTLAFLPLFCIKQEQNIFLERKRVLIILRNSSRLINPQRVAYLDLIVG